MAKASVPKTGTRTAAKKPKLNVLKTGFFSEDDDAWATPHGRGIFVALHKPFLKKGADPKDGRRILQMIFPPDCDLSMLDEICCNLAREKGYDVETFLDGPVKVKKAEKGKTKIWEVNGPFQKAEDVIAEVTTNDGDEVDLDGWMSARFATARLIKVRDREGNVLDEDEIELEAYSGRWYRGMVRPFWYDKEGNRGVSLGLESAQILREDDKISGSGGAPEGSGFGAVDDDDDDNSDDDEI
jgi:hypothetical protein